MAFMYDTSLKDFKEFLKVKIWYNVISVHADLLLYGRF